MLLRRVLVQVRARDDEGAMEYGRAVLSGAAAVEQDQELLQVHVSPWRRAKDYVHPKRLRLCTTDW